MLRGQHFAILLIFIKLPFVLSTFEWLLKTVTLYIPSNLIANTFVNKKRTNKLRDCTNTEISNLYVKLEETIKPFKYKQVKYDKETLQSQPTLTRAFAVRKHKI